ncbi:MAG: hypothetical protein PF508_11140 [Spirochaeta sp.]|jgi:DNA anti-recombination protein RmuC|nr:hypothetical protein [Spirochaeta sp.]
MSSAMELNKDTLQQIGEYVKQHLPEWQRESVGTTGAAAGAAAGLSAEEVRRDIALGERIVRVEEELKTQRDLIREGFAEAARRSEEQMAHFDARFDDVNKRFDDVNKRFEEQTANFNTRFDDVNKRFEEQAAAFNKRFEEQAAAFNKRSEEQAANTNRRFEEQTASVNARFEEQNASINARFDDVNRRFEDMHRYTNRWMVLISLFLAMIGVMPWLMGAY